MKFLLSILFFTLSITARSQNYTIVGNEVVTPFKPQFGAGNATLHVDSDMCLREIKLYLDKKPAITLLRIECHTEAPSDGSGTKTSADFQKLSENRALAVCKRLVKMGVDCKRIIAVSFGGTKPVSSNETLEGRVENRRILFINAALNGHLIGGLPANGGGQVAGDLCE